jgi:uncharacterized protein YceK
MLGEKLKRLSIITLTLLSGCGTNIIHDSCYAYKPTRNYLECPVAVIDQIEVNNLTYDRLCQ